MSKQITDTKAINDMVDPTGALRRAGMYTPLPTAWRVTCNGKDTGIIETNAAFAFPYWSHRQLVTGCIYRMVPVEG